jgi:type VI secretion system protein VasD
MTRILAIVVLLAGCAPKPPPPPPPPPELTLTIAAGRDQNPNAAGQATPVAVHVYQLAATTRFEQAEVFALLEREQAALGDELAGSETVIVTPGERKVISKPLKPGVAAIGVAVAFRQIDEAAWRVSAPVAAHGPSRLELRTAGTTATLAPIEGVPKNAPKDRPKDTP